MLDTRMSDRLRGIEFATDLIAIQGFVALSWLTPEPWPTDLLVSILIWFVVGMIQRDE